MTDTEHSTKSSSNEEAKKLTA